MKNTLHRHIWRKVPKYDITPHKKKPKKKTMLTSIYIMAITTVAMAETFPTDGLMQVGTTYNDAAVIIL